MPRPTRGRSVERTPPITQDSPAEHLRRWGIVEVAPSLAQQDARYRPLADELETVLHAVNRVEELCEDL